MVEWIPARAVELEEFEKEREQDPKALAQQFIQAVQKLIDEAEGQSE